MQSKTASLQKTHFVWGSPHSEWGSEGALAGAKVRYMPQLKVEADVDAPQLGICCPTLHGAALDATWVQLDQTEAIRWAEGAISAVSRATLIFLLILQIFIVGHKVCCIMMPVDPNDLSTPCTPIHYAILWAQS
eukprot:COSAG01_NODE_1340_length_10648_cov_10.144089_10_plen_134_part_00